MTRSENFNALCAQLGVKVHKIRDADKSESDQDSREIWAAVNGFDSDNAYCAALHELGHIATQEHVYYADEALPAPGGFQSSTDGYSLESETAASNWAIAHLNEPLTTSMKACFHSALDSYVTSFKESYGTRYGRLLVAANFVKPPPGIDRTIEGMCSMPADAQQLYDSTAT